VRTTAAGFHHFVRPIRNPRLVDPQSRAEWWGFSQPGEVAMSTLKRCLLALTLALATPVMARACDVPGNLASVRAALVQGINAQRTGNGLTALAPSAQLAEAAQKHACDNAGHNKMSHTGSDGSKFGTRIRRAGYSYRKANENVGYGFRDPGAMLKGWMNSDGHRRNILARGTRDIGVGMATGSDGNAYWVMVTAGP
jgi:uncharacterized protein YkwD